MTTVTWDHLHLRSADPETAASFYVTMFDGRITARVPTPAGGRVIVEVSGRNLFIEQAAPGLPSPPEPLFLGLEHIGFGVTDMDAAVADLKAKGARFTVEPHSPGPGLTIAFLRGPENVSIELLQRSPA